MYAIICPHCVATDTMLVETPSRAIWSAAVDSHGRPDFNLDGYQADEDPDEETPATCMECGFRAKVHYFIHASVMCPSCEYFDDPGSITFMVHPEDRNADEARCERCDYVGSADRFMH